MTGRRPTRRALRGGLHFRLFLRQIAASVVALLLLASPLAESLHTVLVPHVLCAEHGEVVHVQGAPSAAVNLGPVETNPRVETDAAARDAEHEHCPVIAASTRTALPRDSAEALLLPAATTDNVSRPELTRHSSAGIPLVLLAPKTSPPLAV